MSLSTFQIEPLANCQHEIATLLEAHWLEVALDHEDIPLDPDWKSYGELDRDGQLQILTCRVDGRIVGYHVAVIKPHLHYRTTLHAFTDVYYIAPEHRKGGLGIRLFREAEKHLASRGVVKVFSGTKVHKAELDLSAIFERLGWRSTERLFSKVIRGIQ